jgi:hypothetical protein
MEFPDQWAVLERNTPSASGTVSKRRKLPSSPQNASKSPLSLAANADVEGIGMDVCPEHLVPLQLHTLITRLPFRDMLSQMTVSSSEQGASVPLVLREYEERMLREPFREGESRCVCGENCECMFIDPSNRFVGVQFHLGGEGADDGGMCVLCLRRTTQELFYEMVYGNGPAMHGCIQKYGNICGPGEYAHEACLLCPPGGAVQNMPLPVVAHHRHRYSVFVVHGVRYLKQHNVGWEDFHQASS